MSSGGGRRETGGVVGELSSVGAAVEANPLEQQPRPHPLPRTRPQSIYLEAQGELSSTSRLDDFGDDSESIEG